MEINQGDRVILQMFGRSVVTAFSGISEERGINKVYELVQKDRRGRLNVFETGFTPKYDNTHGWIVDALPIRPRKIHYRKDLGYSRRLKCWTDSLK